MRIKAVLGPRMGAPSIQNRKPGAGSPVTLIEFFMAENNYGEKTIEAVRYYDAWGQIGSCRQEEVIVIG